MSGKNSGGRIEFEYIKTPLNKWTFKNKPMREWVESNCYGKVLNLFAGVTALNVDEVRNDMGEHANAEYKMDAIDFVSTWNGHKFDTIILDPPYSYRKSMEMYNGIKASPFRQLKDKIPDILNAGGSVITFGYTTNNMGAARGFELHKVCVFSHGGAIHDTLASVEKYKGIEHE